MEKESITVQLINFDFWYSSRMEQSNQFNHNACSSFSPASSPESTNNGEHSGVSSTYSANSQIAGEEENGGNTNGRDGYPQFLHPGTTLSYNTHSIVTGDDQAMAMGIVGRLSEESWSCVVIFFTFWFLASTTMIMGVYGPASLLLGPNSSILIKPNSYFVEYVKVEELSEAADGPMLYGFYKDPPLDVVITWSDTHNATLQSSTQKEWIYFLNEGSQINISYTVNSTSSSSIVLVIAQGYEGLSQWFENPSYPNTTLSWQVIEGNGMIKQDIFTASSYYVAMRNLNNGAAAVVQLNMRLRTLLYNTTGAFDDCSFAQGECSVKLSFGGGNAALLTSPGPTPGSAGNEWYVKLSYGPRWITYIAGIGGMTALVLVAIHFLSYCVRHDGSGTHFGETRSERTPLLPNKDDDLSSWGSSYDSVSQDDEEAEDPQVLGLLEGKPTIDGENNTRRLCAICFDAPRDCFFLPCGHCVACFACGTRVAEAAGTCPMCRRHIKKVRKIFTV